MIILIGYAVFYVCKKFKFLLIPICITFITFFASFSNNYFNGPHADTLKYLFYDDFTECLKSVDEMEYEQLHITTTFTQDDPYISLVELFTLYYLHIDNKYYREGAPSKDENGNLYLPYQERYQYINYAESATQSIDPANPQIVYIAAAEELGYFDPNYYIVSQNFGQYSIVTHIDYQD
jgi:hypothetical protein